MCTRVWCIYDISICIDLSIHACTMHLCTRSHRPSYASALQPNISIWNMFAKPEYMWAIMWGDSESRNFLIPWTLNEIYLRSTLGSTNFRCKTVQLQACLHIPTDVSVCTLLSSGAYLAGYKRSSTPTYTKKRPTYMTTCIYSRYPTLVGSLLGRLQAQQHSYIYQQIALIIWNNRT